MRAGKDSTEDGFQEQEHSSFSSVFGRSVWRPR